VEKVEIQTQVHGFLAETTTTLTFRNPHERDLEGTLVFPLPEGAALAGYALDVNGVMVDGVAIERTAARVAFEQESRRRVDPGLLEWARGNSFRTRVWPVPAGGTRRIRVRHVARLVSHGDDALYTVPVHFPARISELSLRIEVVKTTAAPEIGGGDLSDLRFVRWENSFVAARTYRDVQPSTDVVVTLPRVPRESVAAERAEDGRIYFTVDDVPEPPAAVGPIRARRVGLFWDASLSRDRTDHSRERATLLAWLQRIQDVDLDVILFRDVPEPARRLAIRRGDTRTFTDLLDGVTYDGGTNLGALSFSKSYDYCLLFTDGLGNVGSEAPRAPRAPVYAVSDDAFADTNWLGAFSARSGGRFLNLQRIEAPDAGSQLGVPVFSLLSVDADPRVVADLTPQGRQPVSDRMTIAGRLLSDEATLTLRYGAGTETTNRTVTVRRSDAIPGRLVSRAWAQSRVDALSQEPDTNRAELLRLGRAFGMVTPGTSLIVLENVEQYLAHDIEPPETLPEMRAEYRARHVERAPTKEPSGKIERVIERWAQRVAWWEGKVRPTPRPTPTAAPTRVAAAAAPTRVTFTSTSRSTPTSPTGPARVTGTVTDRSAAAISDAVVIAINEATHVEYPTRSGRAGEYVIGGLPVGRYVLQAMAAGFKTMRSGAIVLDGRRVAQVDLTLDVGALTEEIEVVGASPDLQTVAAEVSEVVTLPLNGRNSAQLTLLAPGVQERDHEDADATVGLKPWDPAMPYLSHLKEAGTQRDYDAYLAERKEHGSAPGFYLDCAEHFLSTGRRDLGRRILTDVVEIGLDEPALMRVAAHRLQQLGELDWSVGLFDKIRRLRPEDPQSLRDLALALEARADAARHAGHKRAAGADFARALELLDAVVQGEWDSRFPDIEITALEEANRIVSVLERDRSLGAPVRLDPRLRKALDVDLRVVLTWDTDMTDMDLWVTEPDGEKCYYSNHLTQTGGILSDDFTQGYGPEEYLLRHAQPGTYRVQVNYYGSRANTLGPTTLQATVITNFGRPNEQRRAMMLRLTSEKEVFDVGDVQIGGGPTRRN
jgi:hypothetical protein